MKYLKKYKESLFPSGSDFGKTNSLDDGTSNNEREIQERKNRERRKKSDYLLNNKDLMDNIETDIEDYLLHLKEVLGCKISIDTGFDRPAFNFDSLFFSIKIDVDNDSSKIFKSEVLKTVNRDVFCDSNSLINYSENLLNISKEISLFEKRMSEKYSIIKIEYSIFSIHEIYIFIRFEKN